MRTSTAPSTTGPRTCSDCDLVKIEGDKVGRALPGQDAGGGRAVLPDRSGARRGVHQAAEGWRTWRWARCACRRRSLNFVAFGENGHFVRKPAQGRVHAADGQYRIQTWKIDRKDAKGAAWELRAYNFNDSARFEVADGQAGVAGSRRADARRDGGAGAEPAARCPETRPNRSVSACAFWATTARPCRS